MRHQQRLAQMKAKMPQQAQLPQLLNTMVDEFKGSELKLVDIVQDNLEPVREAEVSLLFDGAPCYRLPITIKAEGRYLGLLSLVERLTGEAFPALVSLERVDLRIKGTGPAIEATMEFSLYVVGAASAIPSNA
jgi:Tfp pilus assembly protein PilO